MPLVGKRIMITAPRQYASKLASCLIAAGAWPVWVPSITITHIMDRDLNSVSPLLLISACVVEPSSVSLLLCLSACDRNLSSVVLLLCLWQPGPHIQEPHVYGIDTSCCCIGCL